MQTGDQAEYVHGIGDMRRLPLKVLLLGATLALTHSFAASAEDDETWQALWRTCIGTQAAANDRVAACTAVIDGKAETDRRLAAAYCNRGFGFTVNRELDRALVDLDEAVRIAPNYACGYINRGQVYAMKRDPARAVTHEAHGGASGAGNTAAAEIQLLTARQDFLCHAHRGAQEVHGAV